MGVRIYPVVEAKDFVYGHRYGWLNALLQVAEGFMLRPERELGKAFAARLTLRQHLMRRYGVRHCRVSGRGPCFSSASFMA